MMESLIGFTYKNFEYFPTSKDDIGLLTLIPNYKQQNEENNSYSTYGAGFLYE